MASSTDKAKRAAVIGWPAGHSRSPDVYRQIGKLLKRPLECERVAVAPHDLSAFVDRVRKNGEAENWAGFNVTIPHKETVLRLVDDIAMDAKGIGAANVVSVGRRKLTADNTDAGGFTDALAERGVAAAGLEAIVFGAGGAARAVGWGLGSAGCARVHFMNRNGSRAFELAAALGPRFPKTQFSAGPQWPRQALLWVNATPLGMEGFPALTAVPEGATWPRGAWAYDLVYHPAKTPFLKQAAAAGAQTIGGADMLVYQALRTWELWFDPLGGRRRRELKNQVLEKVSWA